MIKLDISLAVFLYLFFSVIGLLILWIFFEERMKFIYFREEDIYVWQCDICAYTYVDSSNRDISRCPRCNSLNDRKESQMRSKLTASGSTSRRLGENDSVRQIKFGEVSPAKIQRILPRRTRSRHFMAET